MKRKKTLFSFLFLLVVFLLSGCDEDLINKWTRGIHRNPNRITILVFPPIPVSDQLTDADFMKSLCFNKRVREGVASGVEEFNKHSRDVEVLPFYKDGGLEIIDFYDGFWACEENRRLEYCQEWLDGLNREDSHANASCIVFGFFLGDSVYAESARVRLLYYDCKLRDMFHETAVFKLNGRELQGTLETVMKSLLKKACEE